MKRVMLGIILATGIAVAQNVPRTGPEGMAPRLQALQTALDLTDQQAEDLATFVREQRLASREGNQSLMEQLRSNQETLKEMLDSGAADPAAVGQIVIQNESLKDQLKASRDAVQEAVTAYVTNTLNRGTELAELEAAADLMPAIQQAQRLGIIEGPGNGGRRGRGGPGFGGPGGGGGRTGPAGPGPGPRN